MSGRTRVLQAAAGLGVAVATGLVVDRRLGVRARRRAAEAGGDRLGSLRGETHTVMADDGVALHAEVDERSPYASEAPRRTDGVTVVFAHGFALNLDCWHFQRQAFRGKRRMVFYDQRSHGRSGRSDQENATIDQLGRDLLTILDELAPDEKVVLVGHSMGGMSLVALAEQHPEMFGDRVVGVGLISTTAGGMRAHKIVSRYVPDMLGRRVVERGLLVAASRERLLELARQRGSALSLWVIEEFAFGRGRVPPEQVVFLDEMIGSTPLKVLVEFIPQFDALDKFAVVKAFERVPTWIMCGTADKLTSIGHSRKLHQHVDGSQLVELRDGGHMPIFEFKDEVNENLEKLFARADELAAGGIVTQQSTEPPVTVAPALQVSEAGPEDAEAVHAVIAEGFGDRPLLDPPAPALDETVESVAARLGGDGGLLARLDGDPVGALLFDPDGASLGLRRVAVVPRAQRQGVAAALASAAAETAVRRGCRRLHLTARTELPATVGFWQRMGYRETGRSGTSLTLARELPSACEAIDADAMRLLGERLARVLRPGDLLILTGDLGAGKTTMTQGIGAGLGVRGAVTSPTFVISRVHPSLRDGPALVHADAYRLGGIAELDDLDLDVSVADSVTVVEWGAGLAEGLADDRLEIEITRTHGDEHGDGDAGATEVRQVRLTPFGARWVGADLADVVDPPVS